MTFIFLFILFSDFAHFCHKTVLLTNRTNGNQDNLPMERKKGGGVDDRRRKEGKVGPGENR